MAHLFFLTLSLFPLSPPSSTFWSFLLTKQNKLLQTAHDFFFICLWQKYQEGTIASYQFRNGSACLSITKTKCDSFCFFFYPAKSNENISVLKAELCDTHTYLSSLKQCFETFISVLNTNQISSYFFFCLFL